MSRLGLNGDSRSRIVLIVCALPLLLPPLLLLYFIALFGVNVIFGDEWEMIPLFGKMMDGTLSFSDLFTTHNEHNIFFPKIATLAIGSLTKYNTIAEMYFSWILLCGASLLIFHIYRRKFLSTTYPRQLLGFLPVSLLLFSLIQYESILWGFTNQIYLMIFGAVATFSLLEISRRMDVWYVLSLLTAILASFSFAVGLMVWPAGLFQMLIRDRRRSLRKAIVWCLIATAILTSYLTVMAGTIRTATGHLISPVGAARYFFAVIGAPLSYNGIMAISFGLVMTFLALVVISQVSKAGLLERNAVWLSFILFVALASSVIIFGRGSLGIEYATSSRYTPITSLGIIGLYLSSISLSYGHNTRRSFCASAMLALIFVGAIATYNVGWQAGQNVRSSREMGAQVLLTYKTQSDENIKSYLYPFPGLLRERAEFLEKNRLNVFDEGSTNR